MQEKKKKKVWKKTVTICSSLGGAFQLQEKKKWEKYILFYIIHFPLFKISFFHLKSLATANVPSNWSSSPSLHALNCDFWDSKWKQNTLIQGKILVTVVPMK